MGHRSKGFARIVGAFGVTALAASAWAQDYTVTTTSGLVETRPSGATLMTGLNSTSGTTVATVVTLPFTFPYYGKLCSTLVISTAGWVLPGATNGFSAYDNTSASHGQDATSGAFPYGTGGTAGQNADGVVAVLWCPINVADTQFDSNAGYVYTWTTGSAPNRHYVVSWDGVAVYNNANPHLTIQCQLYESSGRIVFAYSSASAAAYSGTTYVCGLDSPIDLRFTAPITAGKTNSGYPGGDFVFDPRIATYTGTLLYDKIVSDASGIGNSVQSNRPIPKCRVELRRNSDGFVYAGGATTGADGSFSVTGLALPAAAGSIVVLAQNAACSVTTAASNPPTIWTVNSSLSFAAGSNLGALTLGAVGDINGDIRAAFNVASACQAAYDWANSRTSDSISRLDVFVDPSSATATHYQKAGASSAFAQIGSRAASNPDVWDDAIVTTVYGRHVLASIAGAPTTTYDDRFDAVTDPQNAFAEGFGYYLWAAVSGSSTAVDGTSSSTAVVHDLEHPSISATLGPDVAGCMAGALFDLLDPANETIDTVDGTSTLDHVFRAADAVAVAPTASTFLQAWVNAGYDAPGITRVFAGNGVLADDAYEPNDSADETAALGAVGVLRQDLVLNRFNEDWFSVALPAAAPSLVADATYDQAATGATVGVEIHDAGGALLATGTLIPATGTVHAATGAAPAGTYKVRVRHVSGGTVPTYSFQAYAPLSMPAAPLVDWTVGRDYDAPLGVVGGIAPFAATTPSSAMPPGLGLNSASLRAGGTPTTVGTYQVTIQVKDGGSPANVVQRTQTVVIHDVLTLPIAPFVGFAAGKTVDATLPTHEGTPPFTLTMSSGALTSGLSFAPNSLHVTGTATPGPSSAFELDGADVAGSADHVATRAVVAVELTGKKIPANLAAGVDACGWWFDAVEGSTVTFAVATAKGQPKRALTGAFLAPDRSLVTTGKLVGKLGAVAASRMICPTSGRYYFVASSDDAAGLATQLVGTATVALPKAGHGLNKTFAPNATTTIELGAVPGSTATVKFAGDKKATLVAKVVSVTDPNGVAVPGVTLATLIKSTPTGGVLTLPMPVGGTWTVVLGATSQSGTPGKLTYSYAIKQMKGAVYSAE
jgi:hypothetical protein